MTTAQSPALFNPLIGGLGREAMAGTPLSSIEEISEVAWLKMKHGMLGHVISAGRSTLKKAAVGF